MRTDAIPLAGGAYTDESKPFSMQDTVNLRAQRTEAGGTRAPDKLQTLPGLKPFVEVTGLDGVRGAHNAEGRLLAVMGRTLYRISAAGIAIPLGTIPGMGRVQIDHNQISLGNEVLAVNGAAGYLWNSVTNAFGRVTDPGFPGGSVVKFINGYFVVIEPQGRFAQSSAPAQGLSWNTLDRFTSEVSPDRLMSAGVRGSELLLLSASSGEFFQATANAQQPFRTKRIDFKVGAAGPHATIDADNNIWWLGSDGVFYCLNGYSQFRISTRPIEDAIRGLDWSRAFVNRWDTVIYWTFPDGRTWGFDFAEREWHRRESYGLNRWRVNTMTWWNKRWIGGDSQAGRLWDCNLSDRYYLEGDTPYVVRRTLGVSHDNQNPVRCPRLELVMDTGQPITEAVSFPVQPDPPTISGDAPEGFIGEAYSFAYTIGAGTPPYAATIRSGALPAGVTLSAAGVLSGTPTAAGSYSWVVRATDANGLWDEVENAIVIADGRWFFGPADENGVAGGSGSFYLRTSDVTDWSSDPRPLPNGMLSLGRISVCNGTIFFQSAGAAENAQVSTDFGATFTEADHPLFEAGANQDDVYWNGAYFYWRGVRSADGLAWTAIPNLPAVTIETHFARDSDGLFLIAANNGNIYTTLDDGATAFTTRTNPFTGTSFYPFESDGSRIVGAAAGGIGNGYSDDAFATAATYIPEPTGAAKLYAGGVWLGHAAEVYRSVDGAGWASVLTISNFATTIFKHPLAYGDSLHAFIDSVSATGWLVYTSDDGGLTWDAGETLYGGGGNIAFVSAQ